MGERECGAYRSRRSGGILLTLTLGAFLIATPGPRAPVAAKADEASSMPGNRGIALTFDDLPLNRPETGVREMRAINGKILDVLTSRGIPATGFVNEGRLQVPGEEAARAGILEMWVEAGFDLGNHTFSHLSLQETSLEAFQEDVVRGETVTLRLLAGRGKTLRWFRHPYLRTGPTPEVRAAFEGWLRARGYAVAPVTVENRDWLFNRAWLAAAARGDRDLQERVGRAYLEHTEAALEFHESAARDLVGRPIRQILLLHVNALTADHLGALADLLSERGYAFLTLEEALADDAYRLPDLYAGPAGVSWLYRWDHSRGRRIDWSREPEPPAFVTDLSQEIAAPGGR